MTTPIPSGTKIGTPVLLTTMSLTAGDRLDIHTCGVDPRLDAIEVAEDGYARLEVKACDTDGESVEIWLSHEDAMRLSDVLRIWAISWHMGYFEADVHQAAKGERSDDLREAMERSGLDLSPCSDCGLPVLTRARRDGPAVPEVPRLGGGGAVSESHDHLGNPIPAGEADDTIITVWCIEPHRNGEADYTVERSYLRAIEIAQEQIESLMDDAYMDGDGIIESVTVKVWTERMTLGDYKVVHDVD